MKHVWLWKRTPSETLLRVMKLTLFKIEHGERTVVKVLGIPLFKKSAATNV